MTYFRHMLEARHFTILTDHKPITFAFHQKMGKCSPRQFNYLDFIFQFTTTFATYPARTKSSPKRLPAPVTHDALAAAQDDDELRTPLVTHPYSSRNSFPVPQSSSTVTHMWENHVHSPHLLSAVRYSTTYIPSATPELRQRLSSSPNSSCGRQFKKIAALGPELANPASAPQFLATQSLHLATSPSHLPSS